MWQFGFGFWSFFKKKYFKKYKKNGIKAHLLQSGYSQKTWQSETEQEH